MIKKWELYFQEVIRGQRQGRLPSLIKMTFRPLSWLYQGAVICRNWLFEQGWLRCYYPPVRVVISIGNIVAGGTGKTPITLMIAKAFYDRFSIAILSRGYRSLAEKAPTPVILSSGSGPCLSPYYCGDEPYLLAKNLPRAFVLVGKNRQEASKLAAHAGVDMILIDDGMQHRQVARDYEVIVINALDPFGKGYFLPRGFLRERLAAISRGHLIIINHVENDEHFQLLKKHLQTFTSASIIGTRWHPSSIWDMQGLRVSSLKGKRVGMFCGIAHPESFKTTLIGLGAEIVAEQIYPDHMLASNEMLSKFAQECADKKAEYLICTEKDKVKLEENSSFLLPIAWLQMEMNVVNGNEEWKAFMRQIESKLT